MTNLFISYEKLPKMPFLCRFLQKVNTNEGNFSLNDRALLLQMFQNMVICWIGVRVLPYMAPEFIVTLMALGVWTVTFKLYFSI